MMSVYDHNRERYATNLLTFMSSVPVVRACFRVIELTLSQMFSCTLATMIVSLTLVSENIDNIVIRIPHPSGSKGMIQGSGPFMGPILQRFLPGNLTERLDVITYPENWDRPLWRARPTLGTLGRVS